MPNEPAHQTGVLTTRQLTDTGWSKWQIERAVAAAELTRVRPGWFALPAHDAAALAAVEAGGCVSCFSALRLLGVWVPERKGEHVRLPEHRRPRVRTRKGVDGQRGAAGPQGAAATRGADAGADATGGARQRSSCRPFGAEPPVTAAVDGLEAAFRCVLRCGTREEVLVVMDSLLHGKLATREQLREWTADAPRAVRAVLEAADARAESGSESMVRCRLGSLRLSTRIQVRVMQGVRVDLLIGDRLIIECDSREHHTAADAYESDRRRDRRLIARGFIVLRLTYRQIHDEWPEIERAILQLVRRGEHRWPRKRTQAS